MTRTDDTKLIRRYFTEKCSLTKNCYTNYIVTDLHSISTKLFFNYILQDKEKRKEKVKLTSEQFKVYLSVIKFPNLSITQINS